MKILVNGASQVSDTPGLEKASEIASLSFASDEQQLHDQLPETEVLLGFNYRGKELQNQWDRAKKLKWIHWCGAGVDAVMFDGLKNSDVTLTNARGIFDQPMAEYVLGYMLAETKQFAKTMQAQSNRRWDYKISPQLSGQTAIIFGVGSIGRVIAGLLQAVGVRVIGVGRNERNNDSVFGKVESLDAAMGLVERVDWVIGVLPSTDDTSDFFSREMFEAMNPSARFINVGRGTAVDESALIEALASHQIAGAMLDVFKQEPLPEDSGLWDAENLFISPHISGDYDEFQQDMIAQFLNNLGRYTTGRPLQNVVDKKLGFVMSDS